VALTATTYSHRGFFVYAVTLLAVDAVAARDRRSAVRAGIAAATACVAALPVTWEHYRYPAQFLFNNAILTPPPFEWTTVAQHVYYNLEILVLPGRWFNDYTGFANALIPVALWMAIKASGRERQYAWLLLAAIGLGRFNAPHFGYGFARAIHLLPVYSSAVLCGYLARWGRGPVLAVATAALVGLYVQIWWVRVPHVENLREFDAALVDRVARLDGHLILLENNWHPDADPTPGRQTEATPFGVHFEALLPRATGKRFYAGYWDGWQWTPARHRVLANGAFQGRLLDTVDPGAFEHELRRWGVRHLVVWSASARAYLTRNTRFVQAWEHGRWAHFELREADIRSVVVQGGGSATLTGTHAFGGEVHLASAREGALVVVRTSYHPSWEAESGTGRLAVDDHDGQIAFRAPCSGDCVVRLIYPTRRWLLVLSMAGLAAGLLVVTRVRGLGAGPQRAPV
jgi:hypothetical protein